MENYFLLLTDSLLTSLILPIHQGFVFEVMLCFKSHHNLSLMILFGVLGSSLGGVVNWYLGRITIWVRKSYHRLENKYTIPKTTRNLLICAVILFSWVPVLGGVIQILFGYFKLNLYAFIPLAILSNFYYLLHLISTA